MTGAAAVPDAVVTCPNAVPLTVGSAFACNVQSASLGGAILIVTITGVGGATFSSDIGTDAQK